MQKSYKTLFINTINRITNLNTQMSKEIDLFTLGGIRGEYFQAAYNYLELFYQQVLIARNVFQRHCMLTTKFVQMACWMLSTF